MFDRYKTRTPGKGHQSETGAFINITNKIEKVVILLQITFIYVMVFYGKSNFSANIRRNLKKIPEKRRTDPAYLWPHR